ncbi:MAG: hypothetical protein KatS3mg090_0407 [Patescibacteria group bacterium]|nr:MAG: hypothetical protein KatS3mg090_0407 [Patescibacteria group bacterium]
MPISLDELRRKSEEVLDEIGIFEGNESLRLGHLVLALESLFLFFIQKKKQPVSDKKEIDPEESGK